jgi:nucleoside-diphosphate-sugar epimerase
MTVRVLVTGISGFLGGHVALQLLKAGYTVRGSVRSLEKADAVRANLGRAGVDTTRLEFVALDLLADKGWSEAMEGVRFLQHTASPFTLEQPGDPRELIRPAVKGTRRAIEAALATQVERVVLTSSIAAIQYGHKDYSRTLTEADWTNVDAPTTGAYPQSKTLAEREAWSLMEAAGRRSDLAVINPAAIFGPLLDNDPGTSSMLVKRLLDGSLPAVPRLIMSGGGGPPRHDQSRRRRPALHRLRGHLCHGRDRRHAAPRLPRPAHPHPATAQLAPPHRRPLGSRRARQYP